MNKFIFALVIIAGISTVSFVYYKRSSESPCGSLNNQLVSFLREYIQIDTSHPHPDYGKALSFLKKQAGHDGFPVREFALPSGNKVLVVTYEGTDHSLSSIALNHHMDVVPATDEGWVCPPFSAEIHDGSIIGRGTQDMKGIGAAFYFAIKDLKEQGIQPRRTIHFLSVPEEEVGGFKGTNEFVELPEFKELNIGFVIDEGHASGDSEYLDLKVGERKPIQIKIEGSGDATHGSHLLCHNANHELISFLNELVEIHKQQQKEAQQHQPGTLLSLNITSLTSGIRKDDGTVSLNMVPDKVCATVDIRVPPQRKCKDVTALLDGLIKNYSSLTYKILAQAMEEPEAGDYETELYQAIAQTISQFNLKTRPHFFEASSDLRFYQVRGMDCVGLMPFAIKDNIHGINESLPIRELLRGKDIMTQFLKDFCM